MKNGKATGPDEIPAEIWKYLGQDGVIVLYKLFNAILRCGRIPEAWRMSILIPIYKGKGDVLECSNYRGIKLLSHTFKIWERIIDKRLRELVHITEIQQGFMPGKSTTDAIFAVRQLTEKYREGRNNLYMIFIDLEKAYDRVPREEIWRCLRAKGVPEVYVGLIMDMYENCSTTVRCEAGDCVEFDVRVGLHQGSALSPFLFILLLDVLTEGMRRRIPWSILYADDGFLCGTDDEELNREAEEWRNCLEERGLRINRIKTVGMRCNFEEVAREREIDLEIDFHKLKEVESFKYLGSVIQNNGDLDEELTRSIQSGWNRWRKCSGVLCDSRMPVKLKSKIQRQVVRPAMLYSSETWATRKKDEDRIDVNEMRMLRWECGLTRRDKVRNEHIRGTLKITPISNKVKESRLRWYGHVKRREAEHPIRKVLDMDLPGRRRTGRPKLRWIDCVKRDMSAVGMNENDTLDRRKWREKLRNHYSDPK